MESQSKMTGTYTSQLGCSDHVQGVYQHIPVGAVTENVPEELRVVMTPTIVREFVQNGHSVFVQTGFGKKAGFSDELYKEAGATLLNKPEEVYMKSKLILKVRQPTPEEFNFVQRGQVIFCFPEFTKTTEGPFVKSMMERGAIVMSYNTMWTSFNTFPVFNTLSEISGYLGIQQAMVLMQQNLNGRVFGQISGLPATRVLILGANSCGIRAALFAAGTGAEVFVMDSCMDSLRRVDEMTPSNVHTIKYCVETLEKVLPTVDVLMGCVFPSTISAPVLVSETLMKLLRPGSIAIDLAANMGGNFGNTIAQPLQKAHYLWNHIHMYTPFDITNLTPYSTSLLLSNTVMPFVLQVANKGWKRAVMECVGLQECVCVADSCLTSRVLSSGIKGSVYTPVEQVIAQEIQQVAGSEQQPANLISLKQQLSSFRTQHGIQTGYFTIEA